MRKKCAEWKRRGLPTFPETDGQPYLSYIMATDIVQENTTLTKYSKNDCFRERSLNRGLCFLRTLSLILVLRSLGHKCWGCHMWGNIGAPSYFHQPIYSHISGISILARLPPNHNFRFWYLPFETLKCFLKQRLSTLRIISVGSKTKKCADQSLAP